MPDLFRHFPVILFLLALTGHALVFADGVPDGKKSLGGSGEMIQLALSPKNAMLAGIEVHGSRYGTADPPKQQFLIYILNSDQSEIMATKMAQYSLFERGEEKWVSINFDKPVQFPENGWVVLDFRATPKKGVYVSFDAEGSGERSRAGLPGIEAQKLDFVGDWMIRPIVSQ
jgi:hypothetical protein